jgi:hypothetical protein
MINKHDRHDFYWLITNSMYSQLCELDDKDNISDKQKFLTEVQNKFNNSLQNIVQKISIL